jgi:uncharacterized integral membrane protein
VLAAIALLLVLQNMAVEEANFLFMTVRAPRAVMMLATLAIGFAIGVLVAMRMGRPKKL